MHSSKHPGGKRVSHLYEYNHSGRRGEKRTVRVKTTVCSRTRHTIASATHDKPSTDTKTKAVLRKFLELVCEAAATAFVSELLQVVPHGESSGGSAALMLAVVTLIASRCSASPS